MTSRQGTLALAIFGCLLLALTGCKPSPQPCVGGGTGPHAVPTPVNIVLNRTGTLCGQNGSVQIIDVPRGAGIIWRSSNIAPSNQLEVHFTTGGSPFDSFSSSDGSAITSGPTNGPVGTTYYYTILVVDGQQCNNAGAMGIIMR
jgi:hypothetical protein